VTQIQKGNQQSNPSGVIQMPSR